MEAANSALSERVTTDGGHDVEEGGENVLVLSATTDGAADACCAERIVPAAGGRSRSALLVSLTDSPDRRVDAVLGHASGRPANLGVVCCDETRSAAAASGGNDGPGFAPGPWLATVSSPGDLTGLAVRVEQALSAWADDAGSVEVCFHSLTALLQYVDERAAFRFCHALTRRVASSGASSHFHLDPDAVDDRTVKTLTSLFDRVEDYT